jgi:hypothetical protein
MGILRRRRRNFVAMLDQQQNLSMRILPRIYQQFLDEQEQLFSLKFYSKN